MTSPMRLTLALILLSACDVVPCPPNTHENAGTCELDFTADAAVDGASSDRCSAEICNSVDDNCDGVVDEGCACTATEPRVCGRNVGVCHPGVQQCVAGVWSSCSGAVLPSEEVCDTVDNDCDNQVDEDIGGTACGVTNGACRQGTMACVSGAMTCQNEVTASAEICDEIDNDCNGIVDDAADMRWYIDVDGDGHGDASDAGRASCSQPTAMHVRSNDDCDDAMNSRFPGRPEICDGVDNDCNDMVDDGLAVTSYYVDNDHDGFGAGPATAACRMPEGLFVTNNTDCDDMDIRAFPGQTEYFVTPRIGVGGFDFDCSGGVSQSRPHGRAEGCSCECVGQFCIPTGMPAWETWVGSTPACGASGTLENCRSESGPVLRCYSDGARSVAQQACR